MRKEFQVRSALRRRLVVALPVVVLGIVPSLAGCSMHEGTQGWYDPTDGVSVDAGPIDIRNVIVVSDGEGKATVLASFANTGDADELVEIIVDGTAITPGEGALAIPARGYATIGPEATRADLFESETQPGLSATVEFRFASAPRAQVTALVQANEGLYAEAIDDAVVVDPPTPVPEETTEEEAPDSAEATEAAPPPETAPPTDAPEPTESPVPTEPVESPEGTPADE